MTIVNIRELVKEITLPPGILWADAETFELEHPKTDPKKEPKTIKPKTEPKTEWTTIKKKTRTRGGKKDKHLPCKKCKLKFVWTIEEQLFMEQKGYATVPRTCKPCKQKYYKK